MTEDDLERKVDPKLAVIPWEAIAERRVSAFDLFSDLQGGENRVNGDVAGVPGVCGRWGEGLMLGENKVLEAVVPKKRGEASRPYVFICINAEDEILIVIQPLAHGLVQVVLKKKLRSILHRSN